MYYLFLLLRAAVSFLPRGVSYFFAKRLALLRYFFSPSDRRTVMSNLKPLVGDGKPVADIARRVFINFSYYLVDFFSYNRFDDDFVKRHINIHGAGWIDKCLTDDGGAIMLTAHLGNYELAGAIVARMGYNFSAVALPHADARTNRIFDRQRRLAGMKVIPTGAGIKQCFSAFDDKGVLGLLGDRNFSGKGVNTQMFLRHAFLPRGFAFFALKRKVNVIPCFLIRENKNYYHFFIEEPIITDRQKFNTEESVVCVYADVLGRYLCRYPDQWYLFEKYWRKKDPVSESQFVQL